MSRKEIPIAPMPTYIMQGRRRIESAAGLSLSKKSRTAKNIKRKRGFQKKKIASKK